MSRHSAESINYGKRKTRGKTLPTVPIDKMQRGRSKKSLAQDELPERRSLLRPRKSKHRAASSVEVTSSPTTSTSEQEIICSKLDRGSTVNTSSLKVEAFDHFHEMLNQCCGLQRLSDLQAASILKQFTPDVVKTVIYIIAENAKNAAQMQQQIDSTEDFPDVEISQITNSATGKQQQFMDRKQQIPELVQPRLASPVSNSCSPVSAAVQALMSFARPDVDEKGKHVAINVKQNAKIEESKNETTADLNVFDSDSITTTSSSPFLQPLSSMVMLNTDPDKLQHSTDVLSTESDQEKQVFSSFIRDSLVKSSSSVSPLFPWIQSPQSKIATEKDKSAKSNDKYLPSISSILGPMQFSELPFPIPTLGGSKSAWKISSTQTEFLQSPLNSDASSSTSVNIAPSIPESLYSKQQKTVFRTILPKPIEKTNDVNKAIFASEQVIKTDIQPKKNDSKLTFLNTDIKVDAMKQSNVAMQNAINDEHVMAVVSSNTSDDLLSAAMPKQIYLPPMQNNLQQHHTMLQKPLLNAMSNSRERGSNSTTHRPSSAPNVKGKKASTTGNNSGKLEVASALLSMGSADSKGKKSAKVVSSFNREKATFDIEESSKAQRGSILYTATGTFQIEDIEIDPKKNKIGKDSYECGKCRRVFTSLVYLARHIKRVCPDMTLRKWKCDRCEKAFRHPFGLQQHIYTHTGERPYKCDQCSKAFYSANDLRRHKRTHSGERPYSCSHCKKAFSTTISLKTHTYIHTGERPHKCPHCPKTFATSSKLSRHVVTHSDKRPFSCDICVKTFNRSGDLRRHYNNVHHLEHGLLSCDQCNKLFATQVCLQNHKATHNRDEEGKTDLTTATNIPVMLPAT
eukprot:gene5445-6127_t